MTLPEPPAVCTCGRPTKRLSISRAYCPPCGNPPGQCLCDVVADPAVACQACGQPTKLQPCSDCHRTATPQENQ